MTRVQMCAPYNALQSYKLKVKLTPGSQRKGRAARQVMLTSPKPPHCNSVVWQRRHASAPHPSFCPLFWGLLVLMS